MSFIPLIDQTAILTANPLTAATQLTIKPQTTSQSPSGQQALSYSPGQQFNLLGCTPNGFYIASVDMPSLVVTSSPATSPPNNDGSTDPRLGPSAGKALIDLRKGQPAMPVQLWQLVGNSIILTDSTPPLALTVNP